MGSGVEDQVFVVTGGTGGLGFATAELLVAEGASVVVSGRSAERVDAAVAALGARARGVVADNAEPDAAARLVATALDAFGRLDGALISVGGPPTGTVMGTDDETWRRAFDSVFVGSLRIARAVAGAIDGACSIAFVLFSAVRASLANLAGSIGLRSGPA